MQYLIHDMQRRNRTRQLVGFGLLLAGLVGVSMLLWQPDPTTIAYQSTIQVDK